MALPRLGIIPAGHPTVRETDFVRHVIKMHLIVGQMIAFCQDAHGATKLGRRTLVKTASIRALIGESASVAE